MEKDRIEDTLASLVHHTQQVGEMKKVLLEQFLVYTQMNPELKFDYSANTVGRHTSVKSDNGWSHWEVKVNTSGTVEDIEKIEFSYVTANDRGPSSAQTVTVKVEDLAGDPDRQKRFEQYWALKQEFDPS